LNLFSLVQLQYYGSADIYNWFGEQVASEQAKSVVLLLLFQGMDLAYEPLILQIEPSKISGFATAVSQLKDAD
jgi:hypothetical protein